MKVDFIENGALLSGDDIYPEVVFDCGQCFRFYSEGHAYVGVAHGRVLNVEKRDTGLFIYPCNMDDYENIWKIYFDTQLSYAELEENFKNDIVLYKTIEYSKGMRLLIQDPFETIISFIISANNNIGRIRKIIERICSLAGEKIFYNNKIYYSFPSAQKLSCLSIEQLSECGAGYRAPYIKETSQKIADGFDLEIIYKMEYSEAKKYLCQLKGIGPKVADCILLFAFNKKNAFPVDVWMKRILLNMYGFEPKNTREAEKFAEEKFGIYAGIVQQYLFNYARANKII